jgi:hypothetical protein
MNAGNDDGGLAARRYAIISAIRISGAAMLVLGLAIIANGLMDLPIAAGYVLFAIGVFDFIVLPVILSRRWKSPGGK